MEYSIDKIFEWLSCNNDVDIQLRGIEEACKIKNFSVLIMPIEDKSVWENCAVVLASKSDQELNCYIYKMFEWLQDMNWPGADIIYERLMAISEIDVIPIFNHCLDCAVKLKDFSWEHALNDFHSERCSSTGDG